MHLRLVRFRFEEALLVPKYYYSFQGILIRNDQFSLTDFNTYKALYLPRV